MTLNENKLVYQNILCVELMDENEQQHTVDICEEDREISVYMPPAPCVGECNEVRFRGPTLRTGGLGICGVFHKSACLLSITQNFSEQCRGIWVRPLLLS